MNWIIRFFKKEKPILIEDEIIDEAITNPLSPTPDTISDTQPAGESIEQSLNRIEIMAGAIQDFEVYKQGTRSFRNCSPGNLKMTYYTKSLGAIGQDKDNFAIFKTYEDGFNALCQFIKDAGNNKLLMYKDCTILSFFKVYAPSFENPTMNYARFVARRLGVEVDYKIKDLL